jgi:hypothetical protein
MAGWGGREPGAEGSLGPGRESGAERSLGRQAVWGSVPAEFRLHLLPFVSI